MKDQIRQGHRLNSSAGATEVAERRGSTRQQFVAEAHVIEIGSGVRLSARSCDLGLNGCYVDTLIPFAVGTPVRIRLSKDKVVVELTGKVVYQLPGLGMGIAFRDVTQENREALEKWFSQMRQGEPVFETPPVTPPAKPVEAIDAFLRRRQPAPEFVELIRVLMQKQMLTRTEAIAIMKAADE